MPDINKVIKAWKCCTDEVGNPCGDECPYFNDFNGCMFNLKRDTIELLEFYKSQEHELCANCTVQKEDKE